MSIRVRVLNYEELNTETKEEKEEKTNLETEILTADYVKRLNEQIAYNINKIRESIEPDGPILKRTIMR